MSDFIGLCLGLVVLGFVASCMSNSILPLVIVALVIWAGSRFNEGLNGGGKGR